MIDRRNNVIVEINGEEVGFRFSTWAVGQAVKRLELKGIIALYQKLGEMDVDALMALTAEARKEYIYKMDNKDQVVTLREAADLIDAMGGAIPAMEKFGTGIQGHTPKNQAPPQEVGETISQ